MTTNAATRTTRFLITRTARLRALARQFDPYSVAAGAALAIILIVGLRMTPTPAPAAAPTAAATAVLRSAADGTHQAARRLDRVPAAVRQLPTAIVPTPAPAATVAPLTLHVASGGPEATPAGYVAHTTAGDVFVPNDATPVPNDGTYTGPFLALAATAAPADAPRLCTGFGDWRDYDPAYASSPACNP